MHVCLSLSGTGAVLSEQLAGTQFSRSANSAGTVVQRRCQPVAKRFIIIVQHLLLTFDVLLWELSCAFVPAAHLTRRAVILIL